MLDALLDLTEPMNKEAHRCEDDYDKNLENDNIANTQTAIV